MISLKNRPSFSNIYSYQEFSKYYWYRDELINICKNLGIDYIGTKSQLNYNIEEYYKGNIIKKVKKPKNSCIVTNDITLYTKLLECGFCFSQKFREFFSNVTGIKNFKFNADMVATLKK